MFWFNRLRQSRYRQKTKNRLPPKNYRHSLVLPPPPKSLPPKNEKPPTAKKLPPYGITDDNPGKYQVSRSLYITKLKIRIDTALPLFFLPAPPFCRQLQTFFHWRWQPEIGKLGGEIRVIYEVVVVPYEWHLAHLPQGGYEQSENRCRDALRGAHTDMQSTVGPHLYCRGQKARAFQIKNYTMYVSQANVATSSTLLYTWWVHGASDKERCRRMKLI